MSETLDPVLPYPSAGNVATSYINRLVRSIEMYLIRNADRGLVRASTISVTELPTDGFNLRAGDLFIDGDGFIKISRVNNPHTSSVSSATALGSVTITPS